MKRKILLFLFPNIIASIVEEAIRIHDIILQYGSIEEYKKQIPLNKKMQELAAIDYNNSIH